MSGIRSAYAIEISENEEYKNRKNPFCHPLVFGFMAQGKRKYGSRKQKKALRASPECLVRIMQAMVQYFPLWRAARNNALISMCTNLIWRINEALKLQCHEYTVATVPINKERNATHIF